MKPKQFKQWWENEKFKYPYRPPNEIDCGMGWDAALKWVLNEMNIDKFKDNGELRSFIEEELRFGNGPQSTISTI